LLLLLLLLRVLRGHRCVALAKSGLTPAGPGQAGPSGLRSAANSADMDKYYRGQVRLCIEF
jgi:hypothetical protein